MSEPTKISSNVGKFNTFLESLADWFASIRESSLSILRAFARGVIWAAGVIFAVTTIGVVILQSYDGVDAVGLSFRIATTTLVAAAGATVEVITSNSSLFLTTVGKYQINLHPGLITLLLMGLAFWSGHFFVRSRREFSSKLAISHAVSSSVGFILTAWIATVAATGTFRSGNLANLDIKPSSVEQLAVFGILLSVASYLGAIKARNGFESSTRSSTWLWVRRSALAFARLYGVILFVAVGIWFISRWIEPVFAVSQPDANSSLNSPWQAVVATTAGLVLLLPNFLAAAFLFATGVEINTTALVSQSGIFGANDQYSILASQGIWVYLAVITIVFVVAIITSAIAAQKSDFKLKGSSSFLAGLAFIVCLAFLSKWFLDSNIGVQAKHSASIFAPEVGPLTAFGLSSSGLFITSFVVAMGFAAGSTFISRFVTQTLPNVSAIILGHQIAKNARPLSPRILGMFLTLFAVVATLIPISIATSNRIWATSDGPVQSSENIAKSLQNSSIGQLKVLIAKKDAKRLTWLPDSVLEAARPKSSNQASIVVSNSQTKPWQVGNLDANSTLKFEYSDNKSVSYQVGFNSEVRSELSYLTHPHYEPKLGVQNVAVSRSEFMPSSVKANVRVNGVALSDGTYAGLPGKYRIEADGFKLIAPTDETLFSSGASLVLDYGSKVLIPAGGESKLASAYANTLKKCSVVSAKGIGKCFDASSSSANAKIESGKVPADFFAANDQNYSLKSVTCDKKAKDSLVNPAELDRTYHCKAKVVFSRAYFDSNTITVPTYTQELRYYYDFWTGWQYRFENVQTGSETRLVRGKKLATATFGTNINFEIKVIGSLNNKNQFTVR